jgi:hypothetical protein
MKCESIVGYIKNKLFVCNMQFEFEEYMSCGRLRSWHMKKYRSLE